MTDSTALPPTHVASANYLSVSEAEYKKQVETKLSDLQENNRLAIHMAVQHDKFKYPQITHNMLQENVASGVDGAMAAKSPYLLSMSLLPKRSTDLAIEPFGLIFFGIGNLGYMVNLDQKEPDAARVAFACQTNLGSGAEGRSKIFWNRLQSYSVEFAPELRFFYEARAKDLDSWLDRLAGDQASQLTEHQLDALGTYYDRAAQMNPAKEGRVKEHSEVLVACLPKHVEAISVVMTAECQQPFYKPFIKLGAALSGLQHLEKGIDLPVVCYHTGHTDGKDPDRGKVEYLARGKKQLVELGLKAVEELQKTSDIMEAANRGGAAHYKGITSSQFEMLKIQVKKHLAVELGVPVANQEAQVDKLRYEVGMEMAKGGAGK